MKQAETRLLQHPTGEPKDQRRPLKADVLRLSAEAKTLLESLAPGLRPNLLPERFPRVMNEIARLWRRPANWIAISRICSWTHGEAGKAFRLQSQSN